MTRNFDTVLIPNIGIRIRTRHIGFDSSLGTFTDGIIIVKDGNGRCSRSIKYRNSDGTLGGTCTSLSSRGGGNRVSGGSGRSYIHRIGIRVVNTSRPFVGNVTSPLLSICSQRNRLTSANTGSVSYNNKVSTHRVNCEVVRSGGTTMLAGSDHRVNTGTNLDRRC